MQETHCPLCFDALEVREVAPCEECGGFPEEIEHFRTGRHRYVEYEVFPGLALVLCDFCDVDFGSYDPTFFGLARRTRLGLRTMRLVRPIENASLGHDKFCASCGYRLAFLRFVSAARELHEATSAPAREPT